MNVLSGHIIYWAAPLGSDCVLVSPRGLDYKAQTTEGRPPSAPINTAEKRNSHEPAVGSSLPLGRQYTYTVHCSPTAAPRRNTLHRPVSYVTTSPSFS